MTKKQLEKLANELFDNLLTEDKYFCIVEQDNRISGAIVKKGGRVKGKSLLRLPLGIESWTITLANWFEGGAEYSYNSLKNDGYRDDFIEEALIPKIIKELGEA